MQVREIFPPYEHEEPLRAHGDCLLEICEMFISASGLLRLSIIPHYIVGWRPKPRRRWFGIGKTDLGREILSGFPTGVPRDSYRRNCAFVSCLILLVHVDDLLEVEAEDDDDRLVEGGRGARLLDVAREQVIEQAPLLPAAQAAFDEHEKEEEKGEHHLDCGLIDQRSTLLSSDIRLFFRLGRNPPHNLLNTVPMLSSAKFLPCSFGGGLCSIGEGAGGALGGFFLGRLSPYWKSSRALARAAKAAAAAG